MSQETLSGVVASAAEKFGVPGVAAGVWADGREVSACHGVTSVENPLPVDPGTVFVLGSVAKTFTATAVMRLVAAGKSYWMRRCAGMSPSSSLRMSRLRMPPC